MDRRKTFEFRMCKKVAELTQVVHMLFTRNHEKEMEMEALKAAYEEEIERVLKDARKRLSGADQAVESANGRAGEQAEKVRLLWWSVPLSYWLSSLTSLHLHFI